MSQYPAICGVRTIFSIVSRGAIRTDWLLFKHVEPRAADPAFPQGPDQSGFVDHVSSRRVDQNRVRLHQSQCSLINQMVCPVDQGVWSVRKSDFESKFIPPDW